ncbi:MAG: tandem-95 repeat protein, partial [Prolixibacteraceae bacterium]|nr:tandem-95 repeat protein [Prolixibacteraceae bacterium]
IDTSTTAATITHTYEKPGKYAVRLATQSEGACNYESVEEDMILAGGPLVEFTHSPHPVCTGNTIQFNNQTTRTGFDTTNPDNDIFLWNFGDVTTSTEENPQHQYTKDSTFTVSLTVTEENGSGCSHTIIKKDLISIIPFTAGYEISANDTICNNSEVLFSNTSTGEIVEYRWDFDNDGTDDSIKNTNENVTYNFSTPGIYEPKLTTVADDGCEQIHTQQITVINATADFDAEKQNIGCAPAYAYFTPDANDSEVISYEWHFGDGNTSNERSPRNYYVTPGEYTVALTIRFKGGCQKTMQKTNYITVEGAYGVFTYDDTPGCAPNPVELKITDILNVDYVNWDYGNGIVEQDTVPDGASEYSTTYIYDTLGSVTPRIELIDEVCGKRTYVSEELKSIYNSGAPVVGFTTNFDSICKGVPIQFTDTSKSPDPRYDVARWEWNFGTPENDTSTLQNPTFAYNTGGTFSPQLIVFNELGCSDTLIANDRLHIYTNESLTSDFVINKTLVCPWEEVAFSSRASSDPNESEITKYEWNFGEGYNTGEVNTSHSFADSLKGKIVTVVHKVTDDKFCTDTTAHTVVINNLQAAFGYEPQPVTRGSAVDYSDESTSDNGTTITSWNWNFEGSTANESTLQNPEDILYPDILKDQSTRLIVSNNLGCIDTTTKVFDVLNNRPVLDTFRITLVENYSYTFKLNDFKNNFDDADNHSLDSVMLVSDPTNGSFRLNGQPLSINTPVHVDDITALEFIPLPDWNGETSFLWNGNDGLDWAQNPKTVFVTVLEEPEPPILNPIIFNATEDSTISITRDHFIDHMETVLGSSFHFDSLIIETKPANGDLLFEGKTINTPLLILENEIDNNNKVLKFYPDNGYNGVLTFRWNAHDGYNFSNEDGIVEINYYNTPPVLTNIVRDNLKEDKLQFFTVDDFESHYTDRDQYDKPQFITLTNLPPAVEGKFTFKGSQISTGTNIPFNEANNIRFDPAVRFEGTTEATWGISDGDDFGFAKIIMTFVNAPPQVSDFTIYGEEDTPLNFNKTEFEDAFYDEYTYDYLSDVIIQSLPNYGTLELADSILMPGDSISNEDIDKITYVPNTDWNGSDSFNYNAKDGTDWANNNATVFIEIEAVNDAPRPQPDYYTIYEDEKLENESVATNDTDVDNDITDLQYFIADSDSASAGTNGFIELNHTGYLTYTPDPNFNGEVYFIYTVCDIEPACASDTVFITIIPVNDPPTIVNYTLHINEDVDFKRFNFTYNDFDVDGDKFKVTSFNNNTIKSFNANYGNITWNELGDLEFSIAEGNDTLAAGEIVMEQFTYTITDDSLNSSQGEVVIVIHGINNKPVAESDIISVTENFNSIQSNEEPYHSLLENDYDAEGDDLSVYTIQDSDEKSIATEYGVFNWQTDGSWVYIEDTTATDPIPAGQSKQVNLEYNITDGIDISNKAWITINIEGKNDAPVAINDTLVIYEDAGTVTIKADQEPALLLNDSDIDEGDTFEVEKINGSREKNTNGIIGSLDWKSDGSFSYTPNIDTVRQLGAGQEAQDIFEYEIEDQHGASNTAKLVIIVKGKNDAPFAQDDFITIYEDTHITAVDSIDGLLANDGDIDHDPIVVAVNNEGTQVTTGDFGKLTWDSTGAFIYKTFIDIVDTLYHRENVNDTFTYQVVDPSGETDQADLHITIIGQNDAPVAIDHHDALFEDDQTLTTDKRPDGMLARDYDIDDNDDFGVVSVNDSTENVIKGTYGILEWQYNGTYHYTLNSEIDTLAENEIVIDSFEYRIEDAYDSTAVAWFYIEITGNNDQPFALNDTLRIDEDIITISPSWSLLQNDGDVDGDSVSLLSLNKSTSSPVNSKFASFNWDDEGFFEYQRYTHDHKKDGLDTLAWNDVIYDSIPYSIIDIHNYESEAYLHLVIQGKNDAPITQRDHVSISETQESVSGNMLENDIDFDRGDYISLLTVNEENDFSTDGIFGILTWDADGSFTFHNNSEATDSLYEGERAYEYFPYTITDNLGETATDTIEVTIIGKNDAPVAVADTIYITESDIETSVMPESEGVLSNDFDVDGDPIKVSLPNNAEYIEITGQYGTFYLNSNGQANYSLNPDLDTLYSGEVISEKFDYSISDTHSAESSSHVIFFITGENDNPVANNDFYSTDEDTDSIYAVSGTPDGILDNDSDIDKDSLFILSVNDSTSNSIEGYYGTITWQPDGSFIYYNNKEKTDPLAEGDTVIQPFTYIVSDPFEGTDTAQINIEIIGINDAPVARADKYTTVEFKPLLTASPNIDDILHNDSDVDGETQTVTKVQHKTAPASNDTIYGEWGKLIWKTDGGFTYYPDTALTISLRNEQLVTEYFEYEIEDEFGATDTSTIQIIMQGENNAPEAKNDTIIFFESDKMASVADIRANDIEHDDSDTLRIGSIDYETNKVITGTYGEIYWTQNGEVVFTPNPEVINKLGPSEHKQEEYEYVVFDIEGASDTAKVIVSITGENNPVTAINDTSVIEEDTYAIKDLIENDIDPDYNGEGNFDYSSLSIEIQPNHGVISVNSANGTVHYAPDENFYGKDSLKYRICDLGSPVYCDAAWFFIEITPVNDPPVANNLLLVTPKNTKIGFEAFQLFSDVDDGLDSTSLTIPEIETVTRINDSLIYTPVNNFTGIDEFTYSVSDFEPDTATAIVSVIVQEGDFRAQDDFVQTNENTGININILDNDTIGGVTNTLSPDIRVYPKNGTAIYDPVTHTIGYMPETDFYGTDSLQYIVASKDGEWDAAKVFIEVLPVNENIIANNDAVTTRKNKSVNIAILNNDYDNDNEIDTSSVVIDHPDVSFNYETGMATYTPADGFIGSVTFEYSVCDNDPVSRTCDNASVTVIVQSSFSDLTAINDSYTTPENQSISLDNPHPTNNDYDVDEDNIGFFNSFTPITNTPTEHGSYEFDEETRIITYTPNENYFGLDWIQYQICDGDNNCDIAEINISIEDVNTPPVAVDDKFAVSENTQKRLYILNNDYDIDGELDWATLDTVAGQGPRKGTIEFDHSTGTILYTPTINADVDEFTYTISDNNGESSTAIVRVFVDLGSTILHEQVTREETPDTFAIAPLLESYNLFFDVAEVTEFNSPDKGKWEIINNNTQIVYTPMTDSTGSDFYNLELCSAGRNECADLKVQVTILNINDAPVAVTDTVTWEGKDSTIITFNHLLKNDYDIDSDSIFLTEKVIETGDSLHVTFNADSTITIAADTILWCNAWFTYEIKDDSLAADTGMVYIYPALEGMVAIDDSSRVEENSVDNIIPVHDNDSVKDNQLCTIDTVYVTEYPQHGMASSTSENNINYSPAADYYSPDSLAYTDSLQYTVIDMWGQHATAWVYIHITQRNTPPVAETDNFNVERIEEMHIPVLENDYDPDPDGFIDTTKTYLQIDSQPAFGSTYFDSDKGIFVYIPDALSCSDDEFAYTIFDNEGDSASAVVNIIMPEESMLFANPDTVKTWPGVPVEFNVLKNDSGYFLPYVEEYTSPYNGSVSQTGDSTFAYYPSPDFVDKDSMTYKLISPCGNMADGKVILMVEELRVPEIISPNNDTKNDVLIIDGIQHYPNSWLRIFNRAGHAVYEKRGYENDWDGYSNRGSFGNNKPLPSGTYYYTLIYNEGRNRQAGFIYIFR